MKIQNAIKIIASVLILLLISQREVIFEYDFSPKIEEQVQVYDMQEQPQKNVHQCSRHKEGISEFSLLGTKATFDKDDTIHFYIGDLTGLDEIVFREAIYHGFKEWAKTGYKFKEVFSPHFAYIKFSTTTTCFFSEYEGAHAHSPRTKDEGEIHINTKVDWGGNYPKFGMAHEIGHTLGLYHSNQKDAIMYFAGHEHSPIHLHDDDLQGFFAMYEPIKKESYWEHKPYSNIEEFTKYWANTALKYETVHGKPAELILAKLWHETHGFKKGVGRRGAGFGIKGKGHKGYDKTDQEKVEYQAYGERWEAFSHFCKLIDRPLYKNRYKRWRKIRPQDELYASWAAALQVDIQLKKSKLAYAANGCKDGRDKNCYLRRRNSAKKVINICERIKPILDEYRIKKLALVK